jgi:hypothetical protein
VRVVGPLDPEFLIQLRPQDRVGAIQRARQPTDLLKRAADRRRRQRLGGGSQWWRLASAACLAVVTSAIHRPSPGPHRAAPAGTGR